MLNVTHNTEVSEATGAPLLVTECNEVFCSPLGFISYRIETDMATRRTKCVATVSGSDERYISQFASPFLVKGPSGTLDVVIAHFQKLKTHVEAAKVSC